ncbi:MAG: iron-containing alcohol dehydrogenase [Victivallaceae bacterium]|jgi:alcohol dehydrogenase class IV
MKYSLSFPGRIIFGAGTVKDLPELIPADSRILLVTGNHAQKDGLLEFMQHLLIGFETASVCGIEAEPPLSEVDKLIQAGRYSSSTAIVATGGGSVIDAGKTAAALIPLEGMTDDYFYDRRQIKGKGLFFAALPTTAGTGAEITPNAVLTDTETSIKKSIRHPTMFADVAIIDPELTCSCPPALTAASGLDAFTQAVESYISKSANTVTRLLAGKAASLLMANIVRACEAPLDAAARSAMAEGSMLGAMAFTQSGLGAVHGLAHPIGAKLKVPHGLCCATLLIPVLKANRPSCRPHLKELAQLCGFDSIDSFIAGIAGIESKLKIPDTFKKFGLDEEHFDFILKNCRSGSMQKNPRKFSDPELLEILKGLC